MAVRKSKKRAKRKRAALQAHREAAKKEAQDAEEQRRVDQHLRAELYRIVVVPMCAKSQ